MTRDLNTAAQEIFDEVKARAPKNMEHFNDLVDDVVYEFYPALYDDENARQALYEKVLNCLNK